MFRVALASTRCLFLGAGVCAAVSAFAQSGPTPELSAAKGAASSARAPVGNAPAAGPEVRQESPALAGAGSTRLESLRNAMVDRALESPVRVTSSAWLDESGRLRHVSRFFSEVRARAAAELIADAESAADARALASQARDAATSESRDPPSKPIANPTASSSSTGAGPARPAPDTSDGLATVAASSDSPVCVSDRGDLVRGALVRAQLIPADGARGHSLLNDLQRSIVRNLERESGRGGLTVIGSDLSHLDSYSRLISSTGQQDAPYRIDLRVSSDRSSTEPHGRGALPGQSVLGLAISGVRRAFTELEQPAPLLMPDRRVDIELALVEISSERVVLRRSFPVAVKGESATHNTVSLPDAVISEVGMAVVSWWSEAVSVLRCEPMLVHANPVGNGVLSIPLGGRTGVRLGDRWMIADKSRIPSRVLEEGSVERIMMAEVIAVGQHRSTLRLTAESASSSTRPGLERGVQWFASPL